MVINIFQPLTIPHVFYHRQCEFLGSEGLVARRLSGSCRRPRSPTTSCWLQIWGGHLTACAASFSLLGPLLEILPEDNLQGGVWGRAGGAVLWAVTIVLLGGKLHCKATLGDGCDTKGSSRPNVTKLAPNSVADGPVALPLEALPRADMEREEYSVQ